MRLSMCVHVELSVHEYRQNPPTQLWVAAHADVSVVEQFGLGRVSGTHAPWLQKLPVPHVASVVQVATHDPLTHFGVAPLQFASLVHCACVGSVWQTPFVHVFPLPQVLASVQDATH
jgi:hypothetical protein